MRKKDDESVLWEHIKERHNGKTTDKPSQGYTMSVTNTHKTALTRLITEAVKIHNTDNLMNCKSGLKSNDVLKLRVDGGTGAHTNTQQGIGSERKEERIA